MKHDKLLKVEKDRTAKLLKHAKDINVNKWMAVRAEGVAEGMKLAEAAVASGRNTFAEGNEKAENELRACKTPEKIAEMAIRITGRLEGIALVLDAEGA